MDELLGDFKQESLGLIEDTLVLLEDIEGVVSRIKELENFGQIIDRIMGGAKSLETLITNSSYLSEIGTYAEICKLVGYKGSQIEDNPIFFNVVVALLLDAVEVLQKFISDLGAKTQCSVSETLSNTLLERLRWVDTQFPKDTRGTLSLDKSPENKDEGALNSSEIDDLLKSLGCEAA